MSSSTRTAHRIVVLADTHLRHGSTRRLPATVIELCETADLILHAGDVVTGEALDELARLAPVCAVLGNNDHELVGVLPETLELDIGPFRIAMIHNSGDRQGREVRMRQRFADADLVVFGHSHLPLDVEGVDGQRLLNPGSPTERRRAPHHTVGLVTADIDALRTEILAI